MARDPYCTHCGYNLRGLTESSKCPECGKPLVEVLMRDPLQYRTGRRYRSSTTVFGLPLLDIALGPHDDERIGRARGIIAIGDIATGWFALGGMAFGGVACGGLAAGLVAFGGLALGLLALGGLAIGGGALGGGAVGGVAVGGGAVAYVAQGGGACGVYARGGDAWGVHVIGATRNDPAAVAFFDRYAWLLGARLPSLRFEAWVVTAAFVIAVLMGLLIGIGYLATKREPEEFR